MPGPRGLPRDTVSPEVSEWRRIERSRRPTRTATSAWPASWTTVTPSRTRGQVAGTSTSRSATDAGGQDEARVGQRLGRRGAVPDLAQHGQLLASRRARTSPYGWKPARSSTGAEVSTRPLTSAIVAPDSAAARSRWSRRAR